MTNFLVRRFIYIYICCQISLCDVFIYINANIRDFFFRLKAARTPKKSDLEGRPPSTGPYVKQNIRPGLPRPRPRKGRQIFPKTKEPETTEPETTEPKTTTPALPNLPDDDGGKYILFSLILLQCLSYIYLCHTNFLVTRLFAPLNIYIFFYKFPCDTILSFAVPRTPGYDLSNISSDVGHPSIGSAFASTGNATILQAPTTPGESGSDEDDLFNLSSVAGDLQGVEQFLQSTSTPLKMDTVADDDDQSLSPVLTVDGKYYL